jgi:hypothetical protein
MRVTRVGLLFVSLVAAVSLTVGVASAAPTNAKKAGVFDVSCDNGQTYTIATNGSGSLTPGIIIAGGSGVLVPVAVDVTGYLNGEEVFHDVTVKPGRLQGNVDDLMTCTFGFSDTDPETGDVFTVAGTVEAFLAP